MIIVGDKVYRNIQEQVQKNKEDIAKNQEDIEELQGKHLYEHVIQIRNLENFDVSENMLSFTILSSTSQEYTSSTLAALLKARGFTSISNFYPVIGRHSTDGFEFIYDVNFTGEYYDEDYCDQISIGIYCNPVDDDLYVVTMNLSERAEFKYDSESLSIGVFKDTPIPLI